MLLACGALVTQYMSNATLLAMNLQRSEALVSIAQTVATVLVVAVCAPFGILAAALGIAARPYLLLPLSLWLLERRCDIALASVLRPQRPALVASLVMGGSVWLTRLALAGVVADVVALPLLVMIGAIVYGVMVKITMPQVVAQLRASRA
jgi:hypothetical protein